VLAWGGSFAAIKALVDHGLEAPDVAIGRYLVAAPGFGIALAAAGGMPGLTRRDGLRVVAAGLFVVTVYHLALNAGERTTTAGTASVVIAAAPAMALLMSLGLGLEDFSRRRAAGLAVAFAGVVVVIVLGSGQSVSLDTVRGPLLVLVAASSFAAYNVLVKPLLGRFDPVAVTAATALVGTAALLPFGASGTAGRLGGIAAGDLALVVFLGLVCTLAGYLLWTVALRFLDPSRAVAYLYGVPVVAVTVGAVTLGESVTGWLALGGLLVVGGVALSQ